MSVIRGVIKTFLFVVVIGSFVIVSLIATLFSKQLNTRRRYYVRIVTFYCRVCLFLMRTKVNLINLPTTDQHYLLVGNHMGMLDILMLAAASPTLFITSVDMRETPGLGLLTDMGGCLYVERRNRSNISNEILEIRKVLTLGFSIVLFPEGASTNGERILPFKKSLMTAAAGTGVPIKPFVINFRKVNGQPITHQWRDHVCWYGDQPFTEALWRMLTLKSIEAEIEFLPEVHVHSEEQRREIAVHIQNLVTAKFDPIPQPQPLHETHLHTASSSS